MNDAVELKSKHGWGPFPSKRQTLSAPKTGTAEQPKCQSWLFAFSSSFHDETTVQEYGTSDT